jgi:cytochrome c
MAITSVIPFLGWTSTKEDTMKASQIGMTAAALIIVSNGPAMADEAMARLYGCLECHGEGETDIGPEASDIAAKYANVTGARDALIEIVKNGGKGKWPEISRGVPMPPYEGSLSDEDIERLVDWMLGG